MKLIGVTSLGTWMPVRIVFDDETEVTIVSFYHTKENGIIVLFVDDKYFSTFVGIYNNDYCDFSVDVEGTKLDILVSRYGMITVNVN